MPSPIQDRQIRHFVRMLDHGSDKQINSNNLFNLLAGTGDIAHVQKYMKTLEKLEGTSSRQEQFDIVKAGLDEQEVEDLGTLLDRSDIQWAPEARNFIEALVGRAELDSNAPSEPLPTNAFAEQLKEAANLQPGETLEVVNISADPEAAMQKDSMEINADAWDQFSDNITKVKQGDHLRVRTRNANGDVSSWISLQANGIDEADTRNAKVSVDAIGLEVNDEGKVDLIYIGDGQLSEPNAMFRFTNERTGESVDFQLDESGNLPPGLVFDGQAGDSMTISVSDGVNNTDFSKVAGTTTVDSAPPEIDLSDPAPWKKKHVDDDGNPTIKVKRYSGPLFVDGAKATDVKQGSLANCYFCAAVASIAHSDPELIEGMIKDNQNGTYTVTFKEETYYGSGIYRDRKVTVDGDLYRRSYGDRPMYGGSVGETYAPDKMEMWYPILEKAYAAHKGSYDAIGNGGSSSRIMDMLIGGKSRTHTLNDDTAEATFAKIQEATEKGYPMTASTYGKDSEEAERYSGKRIYPWHAYSILGASEVDGKKYVELRNPWGNSEPGSDGKNDGVFKLELSEFVHFYKKAAISRPK